MWNTERNIWIITKTEPTLKDSDFFIDTKILPSVKKEVYSQKLWRGKNLSVKH